MLNRASDYVPRDPVELVKDHLIADVVLLVGRKGVGKSQIIAHWAACITDGKEFVPGVKPNVRGEAAILHRERSIESTLIPRLIAAGVRNYRRTVHLPRAKTLEEAAEKLAALLNAHPKIKIVFISPLNAFLGVKNPTNPKARELMQPLLDLCEQRGICVVLEHHFTKGSDKNLLSNISGSAGLSQVAGSIWIAAKVKDGCILQHYECNDLPTEGQHWEYTIEPFKLDRRKYPKRTKPTSHVVMLGKSAMDIADALALGKDRALDLPQRCALAIKTMLRADGPLMRSEVQRRLDQEGLGERHTVKRAQENLQGSIGYKAKGRNTIWKWVGGESESDEWDSDSHD